MGFMGNSNVTVLSNGYAKCSNSAKQNIESLTGQPDLGCVGSWSTKWPLIEIGDC